MRGGARRPAADARLADAARLVAEDYLRFVASGEWLDPEAAKAFAARQAAAKAALAHLELLRRVAGGADDAREGLDRAQLVAQAREAVRGDDEEG